MPDHVHILTRLSPTLAISDVLRVTKANSSKWFNESLHPTTPFAWQRGFGAFRDEYRQLLIRHEIAFAEQYLFEEKHVT